MSQQEGHNQNTLSIAALLRLAADGELDAEQEARLRAHLEAHPEDEQRIEFDRQLRCACRRACSPECCAPESLRDRIRACCCESEQSDALAEGLASLAEQTRTPSFWAGRVVARFGAIAALIALVAVVTVLVRQTGTVPGHGSLGGAEGSGVIEASMAEQIATFVRDEHDRCASMPAQLNSKFTVREVTEIPAKYESLFGQAVTLASVLKASEYGLRFVDAGKCHVPTGTAIHIRFQTDDPEAGFVSLWIQPDDSQMDIEEGITYTCGEGCDCVRFWRAEGVRYVLVSPNLAVAPAAGQALDCPKICTKFE